MEQLVARKKMCGERLRILDLGCGSGDGFEFITGITHSKSLISEHNTKVIEPDMLGFYQGIDINEKLLKQAQATYSKNQNMSFIHSNFNDFDIGAEEPFHLYLANYGALSHNGDEQTVSLLGNIAEYSKNGAIIIIDWLGRFSYEWQTLWTRDFESNQWMDYAISYVYPEDETKQEELTYFPLRIMERSEVEQVYRRAVKKSGGALILHKIADRSSFVGRHIDTRQYNPHCQPLRRLVNSLFEPNVSTNLDELLVDYVPKNGFAEVNDYYQRLTDWWNFLITYTKALLQQSIPPEIPLRTPAAVRRTFSTMKKVTRISAGTRIGNPRASLVEPQLGYCLRELEMQLQKGLGCGHGLVSIFEVVKR